MGEKVEDPEIARPWISMRQQQRSLITLPSLTTTHTTTAEEEDWYYKEKGRKMNVVMEAVVLGVLFFMQPGYPHPQPHPMTTTTTTTTTMMGSSILRRGEVYVPFGICCDGEDEGMRGDDDGTALTHSKTKTKTKTKKTRIPQLPTELYNLIALQLYLSSSSSTLLKSCSLISSTWLQISRKYTFETIKLDYTNVYSFLKLLEDPLCSFGCCVVKRLVMREGEYQVDRWIDEVLPRLFSIRGEGGGFLSGIEVLDVYNLTWSELGFDAGRVMKEGFVTSFGEGGGGVKSLRVGTCYWECVDEFVGFVCSDSFQAGLKVLVCDSVLLNCGMDCRCGYIREEEAEAEGEKAEEEEEAMEEIRNGTKTLNASREFEIGNHHHHGQRIVGEKKTTLPKTLECLFLGLPEGSMVKWFLNQDVICGLKKLGLVVKDKGVMELIGELVGRVGEVEELVVDFPVGCRVSLAKNNLLRSLRIRVNSPSSGIPTSSTLTWILELLSSISSSYIHTLIFDIDMTTTSNNDFQIQWSWEDFINTIESLKTIEKVVFVVVYSSRRKFNGLKRVIRDECSRIVGAKWRVKVRGWRLGAGGVRDWEVWRDWIKS